MPSSRGRCGLYQLTFSQEKKALVLYLPPISARGVGGFGLKRTTNVDDKEEIIKNVAATKMADSVAGPFDFTIPVGWMVSPGRTGLTHLVSRRR